MQFYTESKSENLVFSELLSIKDTLPLQRKPICYSNKPVTSPVVGDVILRPLVTYIDGDWEDTWGNKAFQKTDRGTYSLRVDTRNKNCPGYSASLSESSGQMCFSYKKPPNEWTYFEVKSVSKNGKTLFVEPICESVNNLIDIYKKGQQVQFYEAEMVKKK